MGEWNNGEIKMRQLHELKIWPEYFKPVMEGFKTFEYRLNDRGYKVGDYVTLKEYDINKKEYTGREGFFVITYVLLLKNVHGPDSDYAVFSISKMDVKDAS